MQNAFPAFGTSLTASIIFGAINHKRVSCYALFKGWLLLSQPSRCLRLITTLFVALSEDLETLDEGLGCFPFG